MNDTVNGRVCEWRRVEGAGVEREGVCECGKVCHDAYQTSSHHFLDKTTGPMSSSHQCAQSYRSFFLDSRHQTHSEGCELSLRVSNLSLNRT